MAKFKVGDRVKYIGAEKHLKGEVGIVVCPKTLLSGCVYIECNKEPEFAFEEELELISDIKKVGDNDTVKNHYAEVAEIFDLKLGEEFYIKNLKNGELINTSNNDGTFNYVFRFENDGIHDSSNCVITYVLSAMFRGEYEVVKLPFKPKYTEEYWYVYICKGKMESIRNTKWLNHSDDAACLAIGNCFRSEEEAKAHQDEVLAKCKEFFVEEKEK